MVFFKSFQEKFVTILEDESNSFEEGTTLRVYPPLSGPYTFRHSKGESFTHPSSWTRVTACELTDFGLSKPAPKKLFPDALLLNSCGRVRTTSQDQFQLLEHRIRSGQVSWGTSFKVSGELYFTAGYWEWVEDILYRHGELLKRCQLYDAIFASLFSYDRHSSVIKAFCERWCSETNNLHTSKGEISISLWDIHRIAGLPIEGQFYDEVIPGVEELSDAKGDISLIPPSCRHLFLAYHRLCSKTKDVPSVKISSWISFWFRGPLRYEKPPLKSARNKAQRPTKTFNPSGNLDPTSCYTKLELKIFTDLDVTEADIESTYLAAFLACWLCKFALPGKHVGFIRPSVFKVASKMAIGQTFGLAIPVLANIYQGLNDIAGSSTPGSGTSAFPVHYLYGWLSEYFDTHFLIPDWKHSPRMTNCAGVRSAKHFDDSQAQRLIWSCESVVLDHLAISTRRRSSLRDDGTLSTRMSSYFIGLRSGYLTWRQNNYLVLQPYSPYRFSRQFGYPQVIPRKLKDLPRPLNLSRLYEHWESFTKLCTGSNILLPSRESLKDFSVSQEYVDWWLRVCRLEKKAFNSKPLEHEAQLPDLKVPTKASVGNEVINKLARTHADGHSRISSAPLINELLTKPAVLTDNSSGNSEPHFKRRRREYTPIYYDENNSHNLAIEEFFQGVPSSTHPMIDEEEEVVDSSLKEGNGLVANDQLTPIAFTEQALPDSSLRKEKGLLIPSSPNIEEIAQDDNTLVVAVGLLSGCHSSGEALHDIRSATTSTLFQVPDVAQILLHAQRQAALAIGEKIKEIVLKTASSHFSALKVQLDELFTAILKTGTNPSPLKLEVEKFMAEANKYDSLQHTLSTKLTPEVRTHRLALNASQLSNELNCENLETKRLQSLQVELATSEARYHALEQELEQVRTQKEKLSGAIKESHDLLNRQQQSISNLKEARNVITNLPVITDDDVRNLESLKGILETQRSGLTHLSWL